MLGKLLKRRKARKLEKESVGDSSSMALNRLQRVIAKDIVEYQPRTARAIKKKALSSFGDFVEIDKKRKGEIKIDFVAEGSKTVMNIQVPVTKMKKLQ